MQEAATYKSEQNEMGKWRIFNMTGYERKQHQVQFARETREHAYPK